MIAPIIIDLSGTIDEFFLSENEVKDLSRYVLDNMAAEYQQTWDKLINSSLHQTKVEYRSAIFAERIDDYNMVFGMTPRQSKLGMMIEEGASGFDIKEGFGKSSKRKFKADGGWYLTIPFRHATSEAVAETATLGTPMPKPIQNLVKVSRTPLRLNQLPKQYQEKRVSSVGYQHKAAIYEGLHRRDISSTDKEKRGGYFTFRRVSDQSEDNSWMHSGLYARKLMDKAVQGTRFDFIMDRSIDEFLQKRFAP
jgi:hypothetical protein